MADEDANNSNLEGENGEELVDPKKSKKKLFIIVALLLILIGGGLGGMFATGIIGGEQVEGEADVEDPLLKAQTLYLDMEEFLVNLNNPGRQVSFLKMTVTLELPNLKTKMEVEENMPRIRDSFQVYLRELRSSDLQGSAGIHRLREELLLRINKMIETDNVEVNYILFKEIIVQ